MKEGAPFGCIITSFINGKECNIFTTIYHTATVGVGVTGSDLAGSGPLDWKLFGRNGAHELGGSGFCVFCGVVYEMSSSHEETTDGKMTEAMAAGVDNGMPSSSLDAHSRVCNLLNRGGFDSIVSMIRFISSSPVHSPTSSVVLS